MESGNKKSMHITGRFIIVILVAKAGARKVAPLSSYAYPAPGKLSPVLLLNPWKELSYSPAISLWGIYPEMKTRYWKDTCTPIFIAVLLTIAKIQNQSKCPSVDKWIKIWHIYIWICHTYTHIYIHIHTYIYYILHFAISYTLTFLRIWISKCLHHKKKW